MRCWATADGSRRLIVTEPRTRPLNGATQTVPNLTRAIRGYVRAYAALHGRRKTAEDLGVSRHALWRFLQRGHLGRAVPSAVLISVGKSVRAIEEDTSEIIIDLEGLRPDPALRSLRQGLEEALLLLCASPLATVEKLSRFGRVPASTLRDRLKKLTERGLVDSLPHHLSVLGTRPQRRYFPNGEGRHRRWRSHQGPNAHAESIPGVQTVVPAAVRAAGCRGRALPRRRHGRRRRSARRSRARGPLLPRSLRHAAHSVRGPLHGVCCARVRPCPLPDSAIATGASSVWTAARRPFVTLVLTHADQAIRSLGDPSEHLRTFVATEGELLAGDHTGVVWQQCGSGLGEAVRIDADASLASILALAERQLDTSYSFLGKSPKLNPSDLYPPPPGIQAAMPEPSQQLTPALSVQLTRAEKDALDLLAAWPLCTREQLAGLMGGVTLRRVNQVLRSLSQRGLVRSDETLHMLTYEGLTYLARRDRAAVGLTFDRWSAEPLYLNSGVYAGITVRTLASQLRHHAGVINFAANQSTEVARSPTVGNQQKWHTLGSDRSGVG